MGIGRGNWANLICGLDHVDLPKQVKHNPDLKSEPGFLQRHSALCLHSFPAFTPSEDPVTSLQSTAPGQTANSPEMHLLGWSQQLQGWEDESHFLQ